MCQGYSKSKMGRCFLRHSAHATQCGQWVLASRPILWSFERLQSATLGRLVLYFPVSMRLAFVHASFRDRSRCCLKVGADRLGPVNLHNTEHLSPLSYHVNCSIHVYTVHFIVTVETAQPHTTIKLEIDTSFANIIVAHGPWYACGVLSFTVFCRSRRQRNRRNLTADI